MEGSSKAVHTSREREVRIRQSRAHKVSGVSAHVATLMIRVDGQVHPHALVEVGIVKSKHLGEISRPVQGLIDRDVISVLEVLAVDKGSHTGKLGDQVHGILEGKFPVFGFVYTTSIASSELALLLEGKDSHGQLSHGVGSLREAFDQILNPCRYIGTLHETSSDFVSLGLSREFTSEKKVKQTLGKRLFSRSLVLGELFLALRDRVATEADALFSVEY
mmetsp:Transcript_6854/g.17243  ORF Transcript_6854/g.17243 Transcript_6854/m.17243 type:complete len:219 (+) Transcript_6854:2841-3497(+)